MSLSTEKESGGAVVGWNKGTPYTSPRWPPSCLPYLRRWHLPLSSLSWDAVQLWPPSLRDVKSSQIWCGTEGVTREGLPNLASYASESRGSTHKSRSSAQICLLRVSGGEVKNSVLVEIPRWFLMRWGTTNLTNKACESYI